MLNVNFYELNSVEDKKLRFAVIMASYKGKWVFVRHKERETWEIPGGRREPGENISDTASRELVEETGAKDISIVPVSIYSVDNGENESFGQLFYSEIKILGMQLDHEIGEVKLHDRMPENLTYPLIQPYLFTKVEKQFPRMKA
ncbi:NUDIX domain-containing protein [Alkalicella caledoniensis]|uniref:NUDIX domain-containing protein n=2 Tax=Alkalicella caledoniensis TaxID=2731377 RepID=A0A7G9WD99_ALKCA|nr:NUDIX domain-containing protein [Alkalicella caledoniensis]QNO16661.1 NUDIX domain-containing protein [Alkalicella caledoniensis]